MDNKTLKQIERIVNGAKEDIKKEFKDDLRQLRKDIKEDIAKAAMDVFKSADESKAEKADLVNLEKRVEIIEENLQISSN